MNKWDQAIFLTDRHCLHLCQSKYNSRSSGFLMVRRHHKMERAQKQKQVHICSVCWNTILSLNLWIVRFALWEKLYSQQQFMFLLKFSIISLWLSHRLIHNDNYNLIGLEGVSSSQLQVTVKPHITIWHVPITLWQIFSVSQQLHKNFLQEECLPSVRYNFVCLHPD